MRVQRDVDIMNEIVVHEYERKRKKRSEFKWIRRWNMFFFLHSFAIFFFLLLRFSYIYINIYFFLSVCEIIATMVFQY